VDKDKIIKGTDLDAATSSLSAVECGYLDNQFAKHILPGGYAEKRLPLMNRGISLQPMTAWLDTKDNLCAMAAPPRHAPSLVFVT
jgi:hypothetical protein